MLWLLLGSATAHADRSYTLLGGGAATGIAGEPGMVMRAEMYTFDTEGDSSGGMALGIGAAARVWRVAGDTGLDVPLGIAFGAHSGPVHTTLGGGTGILAAALRGRDSGIGITPFANGRLGVAFGGEWLAAVDVRATREVMYGLADRTTFDVVVLLGKHSHF